MDLFRLPDHPLFSGSIVWGAEGQYVDEGGNVLPCLGTCSLIRGWTPPGADDDVDPVWRLDLEMRLLLVQGEHPAFKAAYSIEPPDNGHETFWTWESLALGPFAGRFTAIADSIMCQAFSRDGRFALAECWILTDDQDAYLSRGLLTREGHTIASWALTWEPQHDGLHGDHHVVHRSV